MLSQGSMPTDGTLLLEHMPKGKQYLLTALSVFFSLGSVFSAVIGIIVIPSHSCTASSPTCDVEKDNLGWKYLLMSVALVVRFVALHSELGDVLITNSNFVSQQTLAFFLARIVFFRLHESPRYLVHAGRPEEAIVSLQKISQFNGSELSLDLHDVIDRPCVVGTPPIDCDLNAGGSNAEVQHPDPISHKQRSGLRVLFDAEQDEGRGSIDANERDPFVAPEERTRTSGSVSPERVHYDSTGSSNTPLQGHSFVTPVSENQPVPWATPADRSSSDAEEPEHKPSRTNSRGTAPRLSTSCSRRSSLHEVKNRVCWALPRWLRRPLWAWLDRISLVLGPEWIRTTLLVWAMWCFMSLGEKMFFVRCVLHRSLRSDRCFTAYTMFNVFLPKMLEMRSGNASDAVPATLESTMWNIVIFTIGGCPGAIVGTFHRHYFVQRFNHIMRIS